MNLHQHIISSIHDIMWQKLLEIRIICTLKGSTTLHMQLIQ